MIEAQAAMRARVAALDAVEFTASFALPTV